MNLIECIAYLVCTQSIGFPTYCRVVTAIENVTSKMTVAFVCKRNTAESVFTWCACKMKENKEMARMEFVYLPLTNQKMSINKSVQLNSKRKCRETRLLRERINKFGAKNGQCSMRHAINVTNYCVALTRL